MRVRVLTEFGRAFIHENVKGLDESDGNYIVRLSTSDMFYSKKYFKVEKLK